MKKTKIGLNIEEMFIIEGNIHDILAEVKKRIKPTNEYSVEDVFHRKQNGYMSYSFSRMDHDTMTFHSAYVITTSEPDKYRVTYKTERLYD